MSITEVNFTCTWCSLETDAIDGLNMDGAPEPGAVSVCIFCGMPSLVVNWVNPRLHLIRPHGSQLQSVLSDPQVLETMLAVRRMKVRHANG